MAKPGIHYVAIEAIGKDYYLFPDVPIEVYRVFRHAWALVRKKRPDVVVIEGIKLPSSARSPIFNSQYCSLFFRPWTLLSGTPRVPHLSLLGLRWDSLRELYEPNTQPQVKHQKRLSLSEEKNTLSVFEQVDWPRAWDEYVRGRVVSQTAADLIKSFLLKTMTVSAKGFESESEADVSDEDNQGDVPRLQMPAVKLRELLSPLCNKPDSEQQANENSKLAGKLIASIKKKANRQKTNNYEKSMQIGQAVWSTPVAEGAADERTKPGNMFEDTCEEHIAALKDMRSKNNSHSAPFDEKRNAAATWNRSNAMANLDTVMEKIISAKVRPNKKQQGFLNHFANRLKV